MRKHEIPDSRTAVWHFFKRHKITSMINGPAGLIASARPDEKPRYIGPQRKAEFPNGAYAPCFSPEQPERLRRSIARRPGATSLGQARAAHYVLWNVHCVVVEVNKGGALVRSTLEQTNQLTLKLPS